MPSPLVVSGMSHAWTRGKCTGCTFCSLDGGLEERSHASSFHFYSRTEGAVRPLPKATDRRALLTRDDVSSVSPSHTATVEIRYPKDYQQRPKHEAFASSDAQSDRLHGGHARGRCRMRVTVTKRGVVCALLSGCVSYGPRQTQGDGGQAGGPVWPVAPRAQSPCSRSLRKASKIGCTIPRWSENAGHLAPRSLAKAPAPTGTLMVVQLLALT